MKALLYKTVREMALWLFYIVGFIIAVPCGTLFEGNAYLLPLSFLFLGYICFVLLRGQRGASKFYAYVSFLPIKRSSVVSLFFMMCLSSNLLMLGVYLVLPFLFPDKINIPLETTALFSLIITSMLAGLVIVGFVLLIGFRFSFSAAAYLMLVILGVFGFSMGFLTGYFDQEGVPDVFLKAANSPLYFAILAAAVFVVEWIFSVRIYSRRDLK